MLFWACSTCTTTAPQSLLNLLLNLPEMLCLMLSFPTALCWQHLLQDDVVDVLSEESLLAFSLSSSGSLEVRREHKSSTVHSWHKKSGVFETTTELLQNKAQFYHTNSGTAEVGWCPVLSHLPRASPTLPDLVTPCPAHLVTFPVWIPLSRGTGVTILE